MSAADQLPLWEPTGHEVATLASSHVARARSAWRAAEIAESRGWAALAEVWAREARKHENEAECLAMLAEFELLGGVHV